MAGYEQKHSVVNVAENSESYFKVKLSVDREYIILYVLKCIVQGQSNWALQIRRYPARNVSSNLSLKILDFSQRKKKDCGVCSWVLVDLKQHPTGYEIFLERSISEEWGGGGGAEGTCAILSGIFFPLAVSLQKVSW